MACAIEGCVRDRYARGWCHYHYNRWRRNGDPVRPPEPRLGGAPAGPLLALLPESQRRAAEQLGVHHRTVHRWRQGHRVGDPDRMAIALGLHPDEIWTEWAS